MILQILGPQASGKDTQGLFLSKHFGIPLLSVGELLRAVPESDPRYQAIHASMDKGDLVDYKITSDIIKERLQTNEFSKGYIMDGWGRIKEQFSFFDPMPDVVIYLNIPRAEIIKRVSGRRIYKPTGETININTISKDELAKFDANQLIQRHDDAEDIVTRRSEIFEQETKDVIEMYREQGKLIEIDGTKTPPEVFADILKALEFFNQ